LQAILYFHLHTARSSANTGVLRVPQKILIYGPLGAGKTTLIHDIALTAGYALINVDPSAWNRRIEEEAAPSYSILQEALALAPAISTQHFFCR